MRVGNRWISADDYIVVESHVQDIPQRLKEIDKGYFLVLNRNTGKFEVHHIDNKGSTYCLTNPYDDLDARLLDYVRETKSERAAIIFSEMEKKNAKLVEGHRKQFTDYVGEVAKDIYQYAAQSHKWPEARLNRKVVG